MGQSSVNMTYGLKYLHFWYHIELEDWCGYDQAGVFINTTLVKVYDLCYSRNTNGWAHQVIGLSGYAGQTINLEFDTLGDYTYWSDFYIDDVVISTSSATSGKCDGSQCQDRHALPYGFTGRNHHVAG